MKRLVYIILGLMCAALTAPAQAPLSLDDCRRMAIENNANVKIAEGNRQAAVEVSKEAFTMYFPKVSAQWLGFKSNRGLIQYTLPNLGEFIPELGNFPLGELEFIKKGWTGGVSALQPVFMGGRIINGNKLAHVGEAAADLKRDNAIDQALVATEEYYWQIVTLESKKSTLMAVMAMVDTLERQVGVAVDAGVIMPNELLKVKLRHNELRSLLVDLDNGISLSKNLLAQHIGLGNDSIALAVDSVPADVPAYPLDIYVEPANALPSTADYQLLEQNVKATELRRKMAVGENMPEVALGAGVMYDDLICDQKHGFAAVLLTVNVPISGWWGGSHKIKKSRIEEENARIEKENLSQMLEIGMRNAWDDLTSAHRKMSIAHQSIAEATENLRLNRNYYRAGISTITDLLDAQALYQQSLDQYTEAYGAYCTSRAKYLDATGQMSIYKNSN